MHVRTLRFAVAASATIALAPATVIAQSIGSRAPGNLIGSCDAASCSWLMLVDNATVGTVVLSKASWSAAQFAVGVPFSTNQDLFASLIDCAACKVNARAFVIPPGILKKLAKGQRLGAGSSSGDDDDEEIELPENSQSGQPSNTASFGDEAVAGASVSSAQTMGIAGAARGPTGGIAAAAAPAAVILTPEPGALLLLATGLLALTPLAARSRRRGR